MDITQAAFLGIVQGITEFLPISSDGHLVVVQRFLDLQTTGRDALGFDILLHCGSLLAIFVGFRDVWVRLMKGLLSGDRSAWRMAVMIIVATVPGVCAGLLFEDGIAGLRTLTAASVGFLITAAFLIVGEFIGSRRAAKEPGLVEAVLMGIAQAVAILPGVSRSGLTVSTARVLGVRRSEALDFSFLIAMPIIAGAVAKTGLDAYDGTVVFPPLPAALTGLVVSAVVSLAAILFLRRFVRQNSFAWFAWYLIPIALLLIAEDMGLRTLLDAEHARGAVRSIGAVAVFAFAIVEVIPPFSFVSPGITAIVIAGSLASDPLSLLLFALAAVVASLVGNTALYYAGMFAGPAIIRALRLPDDARKRGEEFVRSAGMWAVIGGQFVGALRPTVAFAAGLLHMHPAKFYTAASIGAVLWGGSAIGAGYALQGNVTAIVSAVAIFGVMTFVAFVAIATLKWNRLRSQGRS